MKTTRNLKIAAVGTALAATATLGGIAVAAQAAPPRTDETVTVQTGRPGQDAGDHDMTRDQARQHAQDPAGQAEHQADHRAGHDQRCDHGDEGSRAEHDHGNGPQSMTRSMPQDEHATEE